MSYLTKGSDRKNVSDSIEMKRLVEEFTEKLEHDPYQPGVVHPAIMPDDLQEIAEDLLYLREFKEITVKVKRNEDNTISAEVLDRKF
jgi:hypothetical protein